jgi:hypothetical protein
MLKVTLRVRSKTGVSSCDLDFTILLVSRLLRCKSIFYLKQYLSRFSLNICEGAGSRVGFVGQEVSWINVINSVIYSGKCLAISTASDGISNSQIKCGVPKLLIPVAAEFAVVAMVCWSILSPVCRGTKGFSS